ncbi:MAG TPA: prepilin peptidase [Planctomycetota bacterium]|nr:prepilin peptidase [Planctomycetota bacterium]
MFTDFSPAMFLFWWTVMGLFVGSFLNVAIHRLPLEGESVAKPVFSRCPKCLHRLRWYDNIPVVSWLWLGAKCRDCKSPIAIRYPLVELLTAGLWFLAAWKGGSERPWLVLVWVIVLSGLVVATFVDFDHFEIPDEVSIGGMVLAPLVSLLVPLLHEHSHLAQALAGGGGVTRIAALETCLLGMALGGGILWGIGWLGSKLYGVDAMGFGDVKLMAAGGGLIGPWGVVAALMIAAVAGSVAGLAGMLRFLCESRRRAHARGRRDRWGRSIRIARLAGRYIPFGPYLALGIAIQLLYREHGAFLGFFPW